ncbi:MAG: nuclear transport factor 2 family protein, partial [Selenomonadaceae bacterium]|nr:nuclear transport factor 2 family protein [Selenomonadaceae bacterium]
MKDFFLNEAIQIVKKMIKAFFIDRNLDGVFKFVNKNNFSWIGPEINDVLLNLDDVKNHFKKFCNITNENFKMINEDYLVKEVSVDSCIVIAKLFFQGKNNQINFQSQLHFSFIFQLFDGQLLVNHYHVHIPIKKSELPNALHLINKNLNQNETLLMDLDFQNQLLHNYFDVKNTAMKTFCYEEGFPYCYVNEAFLKMFGYGKLQNFIEQGNFSSLAHIHVDDQQRYMQVLDEAFGKPQDLSLTQEWNFHGSYHVIYRSKNYNNNENVIFEWGNLVVVNGQALVNCVLVKVNENVA